MRFRKDWNKAIVVATKVVAQNVVEIELLPAYGAVPFSVGSHIDVQVYVNQKPEIRSYSLVGEQNDNNTYKIAVKKLPNSRGGSAYMWQLSPDDVLTISQPNNHFELNLFQKKYLLIAGGIGITPMIGMAQVLAKRNAEFRFLYLGNAANEMPFIEDLQALNLKNLEIFESNHSGIYDFEKRIDNLDPATQVYMCGPMGMMQAVQKSWIQFEKKPADLRFETFGASGNFVSQAFEVHLPQFSKSILVAENQSLLEALETNSIATLSDCRKGECGLCAINISNYTGDIDHRDYFFSEAQKKENKKICACVSRAVNGSLTIETAYRM